MCKELWQLHLREKRRNQSAMTFLEDMQMSEVDISLAYILLEKAKL